MRKIVNETIFVCVTEPKNNSAKYKQGKVPASAKLIVNLSVSVKSTESVRECTQWEIKRSKRDHKHPTFTHSIAYPSLCRTEFNEKPMEQIGLLGIASGPIY